MGFFFTGINFSALAAGREGRRWGRGRGGAAGVGSAARRGHCGRAQLRGARERSDGNAKRRRREGLGGSTTPRGFSPPCTCPGDNRGFKRSDAILCPRSCCGPACSVLMGPCGCWGHLVPPLSPCRATQRSGVVVLGCSQGAGPLGAWLGPPATCSKADGDASLNWCDKAVLGTKGRTASSSVPFPAPLCDPAGSSSCFPRRALVNY